MINRVWNHFQELTKILKKYNAADTSVLPERDPSYSPLTMVSPSPVAGEIRDVDENGVTELIKVNILSSQKLENVGRKGQLAKVIAKLSNNQSGIQVE